MLPERLSTAARGTLGVAILLALCPLLSGTASAQESKEGEAAPWYRVEILVFRQPGDAGLAAEAWDPTPDLGYPERYRHLVDRELADSRLQAFPGSRSEVDSLGQQSLHLPVPRRGDTPPLASPADTLPLGEDIPDPASTRAGRDPGPGSPAADGDTAATGPPPIDPTRADALLDVDNPDIPLPPPAAYTLLPERYRELRGDAARMRSAGYEVLLHRTWVQPVADESAARSIILDRSGDPDRADWPELQGSMTLHLSRYLHVATRLWLNTRGDYLQHPEWRMPEPPGAPPSLVLALPVMQDLHPEEREDGAPELAVIRPDSRIAQARQPGDDTPDGDNRTDAAAGDDFPWRHAILLDQSRRMRGGELHYLDHPVLGVLVKVTRLEDADRREMYRDTLDWAWEDRHDVIATARDGISSRSGRRREEGRQ